MVFWMRYFMLNQSVESITYTSSVPNPARSYGILSGGRETNQVREAPKASQRLEPDLEMAQRFLDALEPNGTFVFQSFDDRQEKRPELVRMLVGTLTEHFAELADLNRRGACISVTVNRAVSGRKAENVTGVRALFVDMDDAGLDALRAVDLAPHIVVETSPGRHHVYYKLIKGFPLAEWPLYERVLFEKCQGDPAAAKINTCLRVPGFCHHKGEPVRVWLQEVIGHDPYDFDAVRAALGVDAEAMRDEARVRAERAELAAGRRLEPEEITMRHRDYATATLRSEVEALRTTPEGGRNDRFNRTAFSIGTLVAAGVLEQEQVEDALTDAARDVGLEPNEIAATLRSGLDAGLSAPRDLSHLATRVTPRESSSALLGDLRKSKNYRKVWDREAPYGKAAKKDDFALVCEALKRRPALSDQDLCDVLFAFRKTAPDSANYRGDVPTDRDGWVDYAQRVIDLARRTLEERECEETARSDKLAEFLRGFVYVTDGERFVSLKTTASYSTKSFTILVEQACPDALDMPVGKAFAQGQNKILLHDTYLPGQPRIVEAEDKNGTWGELLNNYNPPELPKPKLNAELEQMFLEHVRMISGRSEVFVEYLLNFLATLVQKPGQRVNSAPVLISPATGSGKTFLMDLMQSILGKSNVGVITTSGLDSGFQDALMHSQLMCVEEIKVHEKTLSLMDTLKPYITNKRISANRKGLPMVTVDNVANWMFFSNHEDALRPDPQERRYCVAINREPARSEAYFDSLYDKLLSGEGIAAILHLLKARDLSKFNPHAPAPKTEARQDMVEASYNAVEQKMAKAFKSPMVGKAFPPELESDLFTSDEMKEFYMDAQVAISEIRAWDRKEPSPSQVARAFKKIGAANLGQKRLSDGSKPRVWAIRNVEKWQTATESEISNYFDLMRAKLAAKEEKKPATAPDGSKLN